MKGLFFCITFYSLAKSSRAFLSPKAVVVGRLLQQQPQKQQLDPTAVEKPSGLMQHGSIHPPLSASTSSSEEEVSVQWELYKKHHAKGSYKGVWTTYDTMGDVSLETVASVNSVLNSKNDEVQVSHTICTGAVKSDCATCFDSSETKTIPVATYTPENLAARKVRLGACGMVVGPTLLRSGAMATELVLSYGDGRIRAVFSHAPVWAKGVEPGQGPPQGLKLFRVLVSLEAVRDAPPTRETCAAHMEIDPGNPVFFRPVPPYEWHKHWAGTAWTWGPDAGDRGWALEQLEEGDDWHGSSPVELWNLRLPGGIFVQSPRVLYDGDATARCRLAWMPDTETLLRLEAGVLALQPMETEDDTVVGFHPPSLSSLRCDALRKMGDLEGAPSFVEQVRQDDAEAAARKDAAAASPSTEAKPIEAKIKSSKKDDDSGPETIQDVLQL